MEQQTRKIPMNKNHPHTYSLNCILGCFSCSPEWQLKQELWMLNRKHPKQMHLNSNMYFLCRCTSNVLTAVALGFVFVNWFLCPKLYKKGQFFIGGGLPHDVSITFGRLILK